MLGTSRDKPHRMKVNGKMRDMTGTIVANCRKLRLDALVCIGGGGTHKNAQRLVEKGLKIITLPKTIDNDVPLTDATIGFDTALEIATDAIDRLHSTAHSHHRIILAEIMGHRAGWLALCAGIAGGADVILIPEIPYELQTVATAINRRSQGGANISIVAEAGGAMPKSDAAAFALEERYVKNARIDYEKAHAKEELAALEARRAGRTLRRAKHLEQLTGLESRVTILGYVQRGGTPSVVDRLLATRLGTACVDFIAAGSSASWVASRGEGVKAVPIKRSPAASSRFAQPSVATAARRVGTASGINRIFAPRPQAAGEKRGYSVFELQSSFLGFFAGLPKL